MRIVSIVPSITELLFDLGLDEQVVGLTKFCVHPNDKWRKLPRVGGTKTLNHVAIAALKPDLIIANKEENTRADVEQLQGQYPVHVTEIYSVDDAFKMITTVGGLTGRMVEAEQLANAIKNDWMALKGAANQQRACYAIWENPFMVAAKNTFINACLEWFGWVNTAENHTRYPEIDTDELKRMQPERLFLSSEPFPFKAKHVAHYKHVLPHAKVELVDGELFSWYGSRLKHTPQYISRLLAE